MSAAVTIAILANSTNAVNGLNQVGNAADNTSNRMGKFGGALKGLATVGVIGAAGAIVGLFDGAIAGAEEAAKITRVLENQIKNLGPAGQDAFKGATAFAEKFGNQIGVDDDDIKAVQAKLASFPDAFKAGSLGAEGMERATKAAFDLQAIGIGDAASNIMGIGKAMNDPIKGMAALSKSGVSFTAEQKAQIQNLVEQGKLGEAQAVLLSGIETNAKGAAEAAASPMQKAKVAVDNLVEGVVTAMLPAFNKFAGILVDKVLPKVEGLVENLGPKVEVAMAIATKALGFLFDALSNPAVQVFLAAIAAIAIGMKVYAAYVVVVSAVTKAWAVVQTALNIVMALNPLGLIIIGIVLLIAAIVLLWKNSETFRKIVTGTWEAIKTAAVAVFGWIKGYFVWVFNAYKTVISGAIDAIKGYFGFIFGLPERLLNVGKDLMRGLSDGIQAGIQWVKDKVKSLGSLIPDWLKSTLGISSPSTVMAALGKNVMRGLNRGLASQVPALRSTLGGVTDTIAGLSADPTITVRAASTLGGAFTHAAPSGTSASAGTYQINVNVAPGADPAEAGRLVVASIRAYERRSARQLLVRA